MPNEPTSPDDRSPAPVVWVLMGHKTGDNEQVLALAEALGWPFESKRFTYARWEVIPNLAMRATLAGVAKRRSSPLAPPWPDLVITAGRRNEPIALWIRKAAAADGRRVRLVHLGRPWNRLDRFDLIVTTPQYSLPAASEYPAQPDAAPSRHRRRGCAKRRRNGRERFAHLPRPRVAVLIGGSIAPYSYDEASAERLAKQASVARRRRRRIAADLDQRPHPAAHDRRPVRSSRRALLCLPLARDAGENPYFGMLALADAFVVTADSMSMLTEACATGKPVHIFDLGEGEHAMRPEATRPVGAAQAPRRTLSQRLTRRFHLLVKMLTPRQLGRDIGVIHQQLVDAEPAVWLGDPMPAGGRAVRLDVVARAVARVRALFDLPAEPAARAVTCPNSPPCSAEEDYPGV